MKLFIARRKLVAALAIFVFFCTNGVVPVGATKEDARGKLMLTIQALKRLYPAIKDRRAYRTGAINEGYERTVTESLQGGTTYMIMAVGCSSVSDLDMKVYDASGAKISEDIKGDSTPVASVTPPADGNYTIKIQMLDTKGEDPGHFAYQVFYLSQ